MPRGKHSSSTVTKFVEEKSTQDRNDVEEEPSEIKNVLIENDDEDDDGNELRAFLKNQQKEQERNARKPMISHLTNAIKSSIDGIHTLEADVGDKLIIERSIDCNDQPRWFDTRTYEIKKIDRETGALRLWDLEHKQYAQSNFITGATNLYYVFKLPMSATRRGTSPVRKKLLEKKVGPRRVYDMKGIVHVRIMAIAFGPDGSTKAKTGSRVNVRAGEHSDTIVVTPIVGTWKETWKTLDI